MLKFAIKENVCYLIDIDDHSTVQPVYNDHLMGYFPAKGHLDELQMAEIVNNRKLVPSVFIKTHFWINHR